MLTKKAVVGDRDATKTIRHVPEAVARAAPRLRIIEGAEGLSHTLRDRVCVIGRDESADLRLDAEGVSRHHAKVVLDLAGATQILDLGAKNGTFVNGQRIKAVALEPGDRIQLGRAVLVFERPEPAASAAAVAPGLSPRELEVALLVARGLTNAEIGSVLGISRTTVSTHLQRAFERLHLSSRAELASYVTAHVAR